MATEQGGYASARTLFEEGLHIVQELRDRQGIAWTLNCLGPVAYHQGEYTAARDLYEESLRLFREMGTRRGMAWALHSLGCLACNLHEYAEAQTRLKESLTLFLEIGDRVGLAENLGAVAEVALAQSKVAQAVHLWGAIHTLRESIGVPLSSNLQTQYAQQVELARAAVGQDIFTAAWEEGCALTWEQAVAFALKEKE